ncbi:hypothetical protein TRICI_005360 [Trichomonascus ciferrii]|uniref:Uncharacterized protein n=1 Tax=Trichomonascus ciferrii TaxID=44093 RepID=A0A642UTJ4_9ASCO|nr:hypothetical protein TRICI_005360 [Trichomonascus ciferrii]
MTCLHTKNCLIDSMARSRSLTSKALTDSSNIIIGASLIYARASAILFKKRTSSIKASLCGLKKQYEKAVIDEEHARERLQAEKATFIGVDDDLVEAENILIPKTMFITKGIQQLTHEIDKVTKESESYR